MATRGSRCDGADRAPRSSRGRRPGPRAHAHPRQLRLGVKQDDPGAAGDALNLAGDALTRLSAPAVEASVVRVEAVASSAVDLLTDVPLTPGASYRVDVDVAGDGSAAFTGFVPPRPELTGVLAQPALKLRR